LFTADSFEQVDDSWWYLGDDFRDVKKREMIAEYFDLKGVIFRAVDLDAPLGVSDVKLVPHLEGGACLEGGLELGWFKGLDVKSIHTAARAAIASAHERQPFDRLDLTVQFQGAPPTLPRAQILVGRWRAPDVYEGYAGAIARPGSGKTREVTVPKELAADELFVFAIGGEARPLAADHRFVPWKRGGYWALACDAEACFVFAAARIL
jgi:hypothetical protein